jgi:hypothetical protein
VHDLPPTRVMPPRRRVPLGLIAAIAVIFVVCVSVTAGVVGGMLRKAKQSAAAGPNVATTPTIGQSVRDGQFEFSVAAVSCGKATIDNGWLHATAKGRYCVVELTVRNIGDEARRFADGAQKAFGPGGVVYAADTGAGVVANGNGQGIWEVVNPGVSMSVKVVYDVPAGASLVSLELHDSGLSGGVTVRVG